MSRLLENMFFSSKAPEINPSELPSLSRSQPGTHNPKLQESGKRVEEFIYTHIKSYWKYFYQVNSRSEKNQLYLFYFTASHYGNLKWEVNYLSIGKILSLVQSISEDIITIWNGIRQSLFFPECEMRNWCSKVQIL